LRNYRLERHLFPRNPLSFRPAIALVTNLLHEMALGPVGLHHPSQPNLDRFGIHAGYLDQIAPASEDRAGPLLESSSPTVIRSTDLQNSSGNRPATTIGRPADPGATQAGGPTLHATTTSAQVSSSRTSPATAVALTGGAAAVLAIAARRRHGHPSTAEEPTGIDDPRADEP